ncbi:MAG: arginine--tRNA ligase [Candidatus Peregrinibacteria bacterium]
MPSPHSAVLSLLSAAITALSVKASLVELSIPDHTDHGDFSTSIALQIAKSLGKNPRAVAESICDAIPENTILEKIEIAGPGFLNFFLAPQAVTSAIAHFDPTAPLIPTKKQKICIDSSHPNIAKPLHFGHLRSTILGDSLSKILKHAGHEVIKDSFIGDWGTGFGKLVVALDKWGDMKAVQDHPIEELVSLYRKFTEEAKENPILEDEAREAFRKLEVEHDAEIYEKWEWIRAVSLSELEKFYDSIAVSFDRMQGESFYVPFGEETLGKIEKIGEISDGALVVKFLDDNEEEKIPLILFRRSDGATLYQTRDISRILWYQKEDYDTLLYIVSHEQSLHFRQIFETAKKLACPIACEHISFGLILGKDGKKFSTRKGTGVGLDEVFDEAKEKVSKIISDRVGDISAEEREKLVADIAIGAVKFNDLSQNRNTDMVFDWEKMLSFEGFSGPFLQYSYARAKSILRKAEELRMKNEELGIKNSEIGVASAFGIPLSRGANKEELSLMKKTLLFSFIVEKSAESRRPNILAEYLFQLAKEFNAFYQNFPVLKAEGDDLPRRIFLVDIFAKTLSQGLYLLGIHAPEKM